MILVHYKPHASRASEKAFFNHLMSAFPQATVTNDTFIFPDYIADWTLSKSCLKYALQNDVHLAPRKRKDCLDILANCPDEIKVIQDAKSISFDIIITAGELIYYWEYHEDQHRSLNVSRPQKIYDARSNTPIVVPRFFQRLLRDIWRGVHFEPYTIVWKDWFEAHQGKYTPSLQPGFKEYAFPEKFSFQKLLKYYGNP